MHRALTFEFLLTPTSIEHRRRVIIDEAGTILAIEPYEGKSFDGWFAVPGMVNGHSHCFQRALCGYGEIPLGQDSFWSWRETMYGLANRIEPDDLQVIARQAFGEMLRAGFTSVGEFHYLHHLPDGRAGPEMTQAVIAAALATGIRLVMLPVYYRHGGIGKAPLPEQHRFIHRDVDAYCALLEALAGTPCGIAPHSLRAVEPQELGALIDAATGVLGKDFPIHLHVSEQRAEVEDCLATYGDTPVAVLARHVTLGPRWNLVHATHTTETEHDLMLEAGLNVVLCPLTEAYLGDGLFPAAGYYARHGRLAIGSDSNTRIDAVEELRLLEYGQRLRSGLRSRLADANGIGIPLWRHCAETGASALNQPVGRLEPGHLADIVVLDRHRAPLEGPTPERVLDALMVGGSRDCFADVFVGGRKVADGREIPADDGRFAETIRRLMA